MYKKLLVFIAACVGMSFFGICMISMGSILPSLSAKLGISVLEASVLVIFLPTGIMAGSLLFGPIVDKWGYKYLLIVSSLMVALGLGGLSYFETLLSLQLSIFVAGIGGGILNGLTNALVSDIATDAERGGKLSLLGVFYGLGALGLPALIGSLSYRFSYDAILQYISLFILVCLVFFIFISFPKAKQTQGVPLWSGFKLLGKPVLLLMSLILFFQSAVEGVVNNWSTTYLADLPGISSEQALFSLTCMVIGLTAARVLLTGLFRWIGERRVFIGSLSIAILGFALLLLPSGGITEAYAGLALVGVGVAATFPVVFGILGRTYPQWSGTVFSIALVIALTGNTLLNYVMGLLANYGMLWTYPLFAIAMVSIMLILFLTYGKLSAQSKSPMSN